MIDLSLRQQPKSNSSKYPFLILIFLKDQSEIPKRIMNYVWIHNDINCHKFFTLCRAPFICVDEDKNHGDCVFIF